MVFLLVLFRGLCGGAQVEGRARGLPVEGVGPATAQADPLELAAFQMILAARQADGHAISPADTTALRNLLAPKFLQQPKKLCYTCLAQSRRLFASGPLCTAANLLASG